jgi:hypothetical protein
MASGTASKDETEPSTEPSYDVNNDGIKVTIIFRFAASPK